MVHHPTSQEEPSITLIRVFELFGVIDSIVAVTLQGMKKNILIINFEDEAKASAVEFDEKKNDLRTLSLHYMEDDFLKEGRAKFFHNQPILLDPLNRFATIIVCDSKLVILPLKQQVSSSTTTDDSDTFLFALSESGGGGVVGGSGGGSGRSGTGSTGSGSGSTGSGSGGINSGSGGINSSGTGSNNGVTMIIESSVAAAADLLENNVTSSSNSNITTTKQHSSQTFNTKSTNISNNSEVQRQVIVDLNDLGIRNIKDYCFLNGYNEPTILFLHENEQTWSGRLAAKSNTSTVTAISFDLFRKYYPKIWSVDSLPHDCYKLIPLQESVGGGALVLGMNSLIHINQCAHT